MYSYSMNLSIRVLLNITLCSWNLAECPTTGIFSFSKRLMGNRFAAGESTNAWACSGVSVSPSRTVRVRAHGYEELVTQHYPERGQRKANFELVLLAQ